MLCLETEQKGMSIFMKKILFNFFMCVFLLTCSNLVMHTQAHENLETVLTSEKKGVMINIEHQLNRMNNYYYKNNIHWKVFDSYRAIGLDDDETSIDKFNMEVTAVKNVRMQDTTPEYIGYNTFTNTTGKQQIYATVSFAHESSKKSSTSVNNGFSIKKGQTSISVPILLPNGIKLPISISADTTSTTSASEKLTLTVPPQSVKVPPHKIYRVEINYLKKSLTGDIYFKGSGQNSISHLTALMSWTGGMMRPNKHRTFSHSTPALWNSLDNSQKNQVEGIKFHNNDFYIEGKANLSGVVGTEFEVKTFDVTNSENPILIHCEKIN